MPKGKRLIYNIIITAVCALVFFAVAKPFNMLFPMLGTTDIRPAASFYPVFGMLFGGWGALGCAVGNLLVDISDGSAIYVCLSSFFIQFCVSYMAYVMWYGCFSVKSSKTYSFPPSLCKVSNILKYNLIVFVSAIYAALMIGSLAEAFDITDQSLNTAIIVFFNQNIFGVLLGLPLVTLLSKTKLKFVYPSKVNNPSEGRLVTGSLALGFVWLITAVGFVFSVAHNLTGTENGHGEVCIPLFIAATLLMPAALAITPLKPCKREDKPQSGLLSLNEKMIIGFTAGGILLTMVIGILWYLLLLNQGFDTVALWERLCLFLALVINLYFIMSIFVFKNMEKRIINPINAVAGAASEYSAENYGECTEQILRQCKNLSDEKSEIGDMARAISKMLLDIDEYAESVRLNAEEKQRNKAQLDIAAKIQLGLLPRDFERYAENKTDIYADMLPARAVGGDFYDIFDIGNNRTALVIGDVSGKGVPAAMFMAMAKMVIEMYLAEAGDVAETLTLANKYICAHNDADMFLTAFVAVYDNESGELTFANAGHNPPVIRKNGEYSFLRAKPCLMLGCMDFVKYTSAQTVLDSGDMLFMYTDGVTEAENKDGRMFSEENLIDALRKLNSVSARSTVTNILSEINKFADGAEQFDDITMLALKISDKSVPAFIELDAEIPNLQRAIDFVSSAAAEKTDDKKLAYELSLVCEELFVNICNYAYGENGGKIRIETETAKDEIRVTFSDSGKRFNPLESPTPDTTLPLDKRSIGGMGIYIVKNKTDGIDYKYENGKNILTFTKSL